MNDLPSVWKIPLILEAILADVILNGGTEAELDRIADLLATAVLGEFLRETQKIPMTQMTYEELKEWETTRQKFKTDLIIRGVEYSMAISKSYFAARDKVNETLNETHKLENLFL